MSITISWSVEGTPYSLEFMANEASRDIKGTRKLIPVPKSTHIVIPMGYEGPGIGYGFKLWSTTDYEKFKTLNTNTVVYVSASDYPEMETGTSWVVDKTNSKRTGGMVDHWICTINFTRYYLVNFSATPKSGSVGQVVAFAPQITAGTQTAWYWTFGDGGNSNSRTPTHQYNSPGAFDVSLTITFSDGSSDSRIKKACVVIG